MSDTFYKEIDDLRAKLDIVKVIGSYISVIKKGSNYTAVCPFHHDTNPSLNINTSKQIFKCFVCGTGGNVFTFIQKYEGVSFKKAVSKACDICGVEAPQWAKENSVRRVRPNENELQAIGKLSGFYQFMLSSKFGKEAKEYITGRGLDDEVLRHFGIGYAPKDRKASIAYLRDKENISVDVLDRAGICSVHSSDFSDAYADRIMFPLSDIYGDIVGFSGRRYTKQEDNEPKYINSSESEIFKKSRLLYNFNNAEPFIKKTGIIYVLEGFMDVIALYRAGIFNACGLMGTALSEDHISLFKKLGCEIRLSLDGDEPGQAATQRCLALLKDSGLKVTVVKPLEGGKDADEVLKAKGSGFLVKSFSRCELPTLHSLNYLLAHGGLNSYEDKESFILSNAYYYSKAPYLAQNEILEKLSAALNVSKESIHRLLLMAPKSKAPSFSRSEESRFEPDEEFTDFNPNDVTKEDNELPQKDVISSLEDLFGREAEKEGASLETRKLINDECQLLVKMVISRQANDYIIDPKNGMFYIDLIDGLAHYIDAIYTEKGKDEQSLSDEDISLMQNKIEIDQDRVLSCLLPGADQKEVVVKQRDKRLLAEAATRLLVCKYPTRKLNFDQLKKKVENHASKRSKKYYFGHLNEISDEDFDKLFFHNSKAKAGQ